MRKFSLVNSKSLRAQSVLLICFALFRFSCPFANTQENLTRSKADLSDTHRQAVISRKSAQEISDFTGTWVMNRTLSQSPSAVLDKTEVTLLVRQTAEHLTVEQKLKLNGREQPGQPLSFNLSGKPSEAAVSRPVAGKAALTARWLAKEQKLELRTVIKTQLQDAKGEPTDDVTLVTAEYWELLDQGKTLKLVRMRDWPGRNETSRLIFERKQ